MTVTVDWMDGLQDYLVHRAALAGLVGTRVYPDELPATDAASMPQRAIVLRATTGSRPASNAAVLDPRVDVTCYGATLKEARSLWLTVAEELQALARGVHARCLLHGAVLLAGPIGTRDPETHWPLYWGSWQVTAGTEEAGG